MVYGPRFVVEKYFEPAMVLVSLWTVGEDNFYWRFEVQPCSFIDAAAALAVLRSDISLVTRLARAKIRSGPLIPSSGSIPAARSFSSSARRVTASDARSAPSANSASFSALDLRFLRAGLFVGAFSSPMSSCLRSFLSAARSFLRRAACYAVTSRWHAVHNVLILARVQRPPPSKTPTMWSACHALPLSALSIRPFFWALVSREVNSG